MPYQTSSEATVLSLTQATEIVAPEPFKYFGKDPANGAIRIRCGRDRYWIEGVAEVSTVVGNRQVFRTRTCPTKSVVLIARGYKNNRLFLVQGSVIKRDVLGAKKTPGTTAMKAEVYSKALQRISAACAAGADPCVSIGFIAHHVQRCRASVYRDVKAGRLPQPTKVGRSSTWPFSAVDLYGRGLSPANVLKQSL